MTKQKWTSADLPARSNEQLHRAFKTRFDGWSESNQEDLECAFRRGFRYGEGLFIAHMNARYPKPEGVSQLVRRCNEARADAWDEGRKAGMDDMERSEMDGTWGESTANPYREAGQ